MITALGRLGEDRRVVVGLTGAAVLIVVLALVLLGRDARQAAPRGPVGGPGGLDVGRAGSARFSGPSVGVRDGRPVGGVRTFRVERGERVRLAVLADFADEVRVRGQRATATVGPEAPAIVSFRGTRAGVFPIDLVGAGIRVARFRVTS